MWCPVTILFALLSLVSAGRDEVIGKCLEGLIPPWDHRRPTFELAMRLMADRNHRTLVETGTSRYGPENCHNDGCSTIVLARWALFNPGMSLDSVDVSPRNVETARFNVRDFSMAKVHCSDSIPFLQSLDKRIDFLYLDSFDIDTNNPLPSQHHHLKEIIAAYDKLHRDSVVLLDDCGLPRKGKCGLVEEFLLGRGWQVLLSGYQTLLVQQASLTADPITEEIVSTLRDTSDQITKLIENFERLLVVQK
jgi:hypothetical protein